MSGAEKVLEDLRRKLEEKKKDQKSKAKASPKAKAKCKAKSKSSKSKDTEKSGAPVLELTETDNVQSKKGANKQCPTGPKKKGTETVGQKQHCQKQQKCNSSSQLEGLDIQDVQTPWPWFSCKRKLPEQFPQDTLHRFKSRCYHRTLGYFKRQGVDATKAKLFAGAAHEKGRKQWAVLFPDQ